MKFLVYFLVILALEVNSDVNTLDPNDDIYKTTINELQMTFNKHGSPMAMDTSIESANFSIYPFIAAVVSNTYKYICSAALVYDRMFLTSSTCVTSPYLHIMLQPTSGIWTNDSTTTEVTKIVKYRSEENVQDHPVAILITKPYRYVSGVLPILVSNDTTCGKNECIAIGFGLGVTTDEDTELLTDMPELPGDTSRSLQQVVLHDVIDVLDTTIVRCFNDLGSPVISNNVLAGVVTKGPDECGNLTDTPLVYVTLAVNFYYWVDKVITNEVNQSESMAYINLRANQKYTNSHATCVNGGLDFKLVVAIVYFTIYLRNL